MSSCTWLLGEMKSTIKELFLFVSIILSKILTRSDDGESRPCEGDEQREGFIIGRVVINHNKLPTPCFHRVPRYALKSCGAFES